MRRVSVSRAALHRAELRRVALPAAGWPGGARRGASGGGGDDNPYFPAGMPQELKDSIVLWYDLERQGATNESMSLSPILKDLSGNGNDATCYNFGWSGMSGIGGYITKDTHFEFTEENYFKYIILNPPKHITVTFTIKGLVSGNKVTMQSLNGNIYGEWTTDGTYTVDSDRLDDSNILIYNGIGTNRGNFTVDVLPLSLYPNALVSDGVDDYAFVQDKYDDEGNLINKKSLVLNRENGYTVIAKRKWLNDIGIFLSKTKSNEDGAFQLERYYSQGNEYTTSFGNNIQHYEMPTDISWMTSTSYNGITIIPGDKSDNDYMIFGKLSQNTNPDSKIALYSLILFNRDLTDEEIEWVKNNLIQ